MTIGIVPVAVRGVLMTIEIVPVKVENRTEVNVHLHVRKAQDVFSGASLVAAPKDDTLNT